MNHIQDLISRGVLTSVTLGKSALPDRKFFCNVRSAELEGNVQGHGATVQGAFDEAMTQVERSLGHVHQTRPVTTTFQMPEVPVTRLRMPGL